MIDDKIKVVKLNNIDDDTNLDTSSTYDSTKSQEKSL